MTNAVQNEESSVPAQQAGDQKPTDQVSTPTDQLSTLKIDQPKLAGASKAESKSVCDFGPKPAKRAAGEQLWKLVRGKFLLTFHLCKGCKDRLFYSSGKAVRNGEMVSIKIDLCSHCVELNTRASDLFATQKNW